MSTEDKINQPVEDVFSGVEENKTSPSTPKSAPQPSTPENIDIAEASLGQDVPLTPDSQSDGVSEPQVYSGVAPEGFKVGKILFYLIWSLIIILGAFAIWALIF